MTYALLTALAIILAFAAMASWVVGMVSFIRLFRANLSEHASVRAASEPLQSRRRIAKSRATASVVVFLTALAGCTAVILLRNYLVVP